VPGKLFNFKDVNANHGHDFGDYVLKSFSSLPQNENSYMIKSGLS